MMKTVNGVKIWCHSYVNKVVLPDYKMKEEDKENEENGDFIFSYGNDIVEIITWQSVD